MLEEQGDPQAFDQFREARDQWIEIERPAASHSHQLAWLLATCPVASIRDAEESLRYAAKATELAPENPNYVSVQALATLLVGDPDRALALLDRSNKLRGHSIDQDWFVQAMAHHESGKIDESKQAYTEGAKWMEENRPHDAEMRLLRKMAESKLGKIGEPREL